LITTSLLTGCALGPDPKPPALPDLDARFAGASEGSAAPSSDSAWWQKLGDPVLDGIVKEALEKNYDLAIAVERIQEARALRREARASLFPALLGRADYTDVGISETQNAAVNPIAAFGGPVPNRAESWTTGFDASWEVDVFGGNRRRTQAARFREEATSERASGVRLSLVAEVVDTYYTLAGLRSQQGRLRENVARQRTTTEMVSRLQREGLRSELDLRRANAQLATTQAAEPTVGSSITVQLRRLSLLMGCKPGTVDELVPRLRGFPARLPVARAGLPADLVMRRPDLREAERNLGAATADIGVATAAFYPRFILLGSPQLTSGSSADLFNVNSLAWRAGPRIEWSLFNGGANQAALATAKSRERQALLNFEKLVISAVGEVESSLATLQAEARRLHFLQSAVRETQASVDLSAKLYGEGLEDLVSVLLEQERLIATQLDEVSSRTALVSAWVRLHKSLGGGWDN
jgi:multidrug efflux system outer membrane protein